jgi:hypothetical protein
MELSEPLYIVCHRSEIKKELTHYKKVEESRIETFDKFEIRYSEASEEVKRYWWYNF